MLFAFQFLSKGKNKAISNLCNSDILYCPDGEVVSRNSDIKCRFDDCTLDNYKCETDFKNCADGRILMRDADTCQFDLCEEMLDMKAEGEKCLGDYDCQDNLICKKNWKTQRYVCEIPLWLDGVSCDDYDLYDEDTIISVDTCAECVCSGEVLICAAEECLSNDSVQINLQKTVADFISSWNDQDENLDLITGDYQNIKVDIFEINDYELNNEKSSNYSLVYDVYLKVNKTDEMILEMAQRLYFLPEEMFWSVSSYNYIQK
jgi:hypothetical protein